MWSCYGYLLFFLFGLVGGGVQLSPLGTAATKWPIVPAPGDYDDGEIGGMICRGNRSTGRKPAPLPLYPPQTPHAARTRTRAATVGSQRLAAWATAQPFLCLDFIPSWPLAITNKPLELGNVNWGNKQAYVHLPFSYWVVLDSNSNRFQQNFTSNFFQAKLVNLFREIR
jgi:hypothetical protein